HPWVRTVWEPEQRNPLRIQLPAGAVLAGGGCGRPAGGGICVVLGSDFGTPPVTPPPEMLRRPVSHPGISGDADFRLLVATIDPDGDGRRSSVWMSLIERLAQTHGAPSFSSRVLGWGTVENILFGFERGDRGVHWQTDGHGGGVLGALQWRR